MRRAIGGVTFLLLLLAAPLAAVNNPVTINVDATANAHTIDPRIYGVAFADAATITDLDLPLNRWGGNTSTRYNWLTFWANLANDWCFYNVDESNGDMGKPDDFVTFSRNAGAQPVLTVPMIGWTAKNSVGWSFDVDKYGAQDTCDVYHPKAGKGILKATGVPIAADPNDANQPATSAFEASWIQHLVATFGNAAAGGVKYYSLDNEPGLWHETHRDVFPNPLTYDVAWSRMQEYALAIKAQDPTALVTGPEEWGWLGYFESAAGSGDRANHGSTYYVEWLLQQGRSYELAHGKRLLDVFALHFYPQGDLAQPQHHFEFSDDVSPATQALRNRSTRALWDPAYVDQSWIGVNAYNGGKVMLIPLMKQWVQNNYPGTLIGLTEYNWGAEDHINGATAQADVLGILGREGADIAARWTSPASGSFAYKAFTMFRNYDGQHSKFGDTSVGASGPDPDAIAVFGALRSSDHALTVMLISKTLSGDTPATLNLSHFVAKSGTVVQTWRLDAGKVITQLANLAVQGSSLALTLPPQTITLLIIPSAKAPGAPILKTATPGNRQATFAFDPPADDGGASIQSYTITCNPGAISAAGGASPITVNNLTNGVQYSCVATATNVVGTGPASTLILVTPVGGRLRGDANGDGFADVIWRNGSTGNNSMWFFNGTSVIATAGLPSVADVNFKIAGIGDFQGDGKADVLWRNIATGANVEWLMNGPLVAVSTLLPKMSDPNWTVAGVADFQGDGKDDILWRNTATGDDSLWLMNGTSVAVFASLPSVTDTSWKIAGLGDFQGDGKADVFWRNSVSGANVVWLMDGPNVAVSAILPTVADSNWKIAGIGDLQGDGKSDVVWRNSSSGDDAVWFMDGAGLAVTAPLTSVPEGNWKIVRIADFQGDGKADILWRNSSTGSNAQWLMDGPAIAVSSALPAVQDTNWQVAGPP